MRRRDFVRAGLAGAATLGVTAPELVASAAAPEPRVGSGANATFQLNYAPHFGMFSAHAGDDLISQLRFMHEQGFRGLEDNGMKGRPVEVQERIGSELARLGMQMGVFVAHSISWSEPTLARGDAASREEFLREIRESVDVARRVNATWMTVVPGHVDLRQHMNYQTAHVVESLRRAAEILEPHGLVIVIEPLNWLRDHPGQFLSEIPQAYQICRAVDSPSIKILFDIYHQQITEGNLIPNLDRAWSEVAYIQIGDNPGRREPTTGEINYLNVFRHIHGKGYRGVLGMEHGKSRPGREGEQALIAAYRQVDSFTPIV
jgi:hydroxypyruvate isomerase